MAAERIDKIYEDAVASGLIPGVSVIAGDRDGNILYRKSLGVSSLKEGRNSPPFNEDTVCAIASMSKLMTSVAVLRAVEEGKLDLDADIRPAHPEMGQHGIITGFNEETKEGIFEPDSTPITVRMLLSHTSGHEYDWLSQFLGQWRAARGEIPWSGPRVEDKSALPLIFKPGTKWAYGGGHDWAGKVVEVATGETLENFMRTRFWEPLGIQNDITFYPKENPSIKERLADFATLNEKGEPPATDFSQFDILFGGKDCLGGGGLFSSSRAYFQFLGAVFRRDPKLLTSASYEELFRPQLDADGEEALNAYLACSPIHTQFLCRGIPADVRKQWSFAGLVAKEGRDGWFSKGTTFWAGVSSVTWWMDHEAGHFGTAFVQILPPMHPPVIALHTEFEKGVWEISKGKK
ncbi:beta-lactamase/transpeptidase-like protein [Podospora fimiseda]|uniref:Beta-lactamase/transpeptidase-like protein n=1 Tax=Podospora fimiseda TaxID=252190 RepID=A0AAN6YPQ4_9PEZI|nr:beta-lactamase/transpeptidase-like protein [Podospora fimiseda]